ncbi:DUF305 domain-containing protein [Nocardia aurantia]|uniref:DUF305 domain-containing protein n=1 Tax=Nocardia aurantia TaxID=2585199 RepID=A0A7K0DPU3_9NOCA|nr:DUF305 domain-containing protein [Nocardia aurantia]MQY27773.1 hypothetical protein [Nocardia aurantia]
MTVRRGGVALAGLGAALLLMVMGAALRPLLWPEPTPAPKVLSATEIAFVQDMTEHHQQALLLVQRLDPGADPMVVRLAQQIADTQRGEIGMMLGWLRLAGATTTDPAPMAWMHAAAPSAHHGASAAVAPDTMPGMATQADLDGLAHATGRDAAIRFLNLMQRHHYGGIAMAQAADHLLTTGVVKQAARDMITTQSRETGLLGLLLDKETGPLGR